MKIATIWWVDSAVDADVSGFHSVSDPMTPLDVVSCGVLLENDPDKEHVTISRDIFVQTTGDNTVRNRLCIPRKAIKSIVMSDFELE